MTGRVEKRWRREGEGGGGWKLNEGRREGGGGLLCVYSSNMLTRMRAEWVREVINRGFLPSSFRDTQPTGCWFDADVLSIRDPRALPS